MGKPVRWLRAKLRGGTFAYLPWGDYPPNSIPMATQFAFSRESWLLIIASIATIASLLVAFPSTSKAYYTLPQPLPVPTQNYYQYTIRPAQLPQSSLLAPRPIEPIKPLAPSYVPPAPASTIRPLTYPAYPTYTPSPYRLSPYSPYSGSNVSDYMLGIRRPVFISY